MKIRNKKYKGITLLEVMSVIAIISIFAVISWQQLADSRRHAEVEAAASEVASLINQARNNALTGKKGEFKDGTIAVPDGYGVVISNGTGVKEGIIGIGSGDLLQDLFDLLPNRKDLAFEEENYYRSNVELVLDHTGPGGQFNYAAYVYSVPDGVPLPLVVSDHSQPEIEVRSRHDSSITKTVEINQYRAYVK